MRKRLKLSFERLEDTLTLVSPLEAPSVLGGYLGPSLDRDASVSDILKYYSGLGFTFSQDENGNYSMTGGASYSGPEIKIDPVTIMGEGYDPDKDIDNQYGIAMQAKLGQLLEEHRPELYMRSGNGSTDDFYGSTDSDDGSMDFEGSMDFDNPNGVNENIVFNQLMIGDFTDLKSGTYTMKNGRVEYSSKMSESGAKFEIVLEEVLVTASSNTSAGSNFPEIPEQLSQLVSSLGIAGNHLEINNRILKNTEFVGVLGKALSTVDFLGFVFDANEFHKDPNWIDLAQIVTWGVGYGSKDPRVKLGAGAAAIILEIYEIHSESNN